MTCPDCKRQNTLVRNTKRDIYSVEGKLLWEAYICTVCGYKTLHPTKEDK